MYSTTSHACEYPININNDLLLFVCMYLQWIWKGYPLPTQDISFLLFGTMLIRALKIYNFGLTVYPANMFLLKIGIYLTWLWYHHFPRITKSRYQLE